jgi:hypothetical protein
MAKHTVKQGECISSIADKYGLFWDTLWNHPENAELKRQRKDPNVLLAGDEVFIPEKEEKNESCETEQTHRFRLKGVPAKLRLRLMRPAEPAIRQAEEGSASYPPPSVVSSEDPEEPSPAAEPEPRANVRYVVEIDGRTTEGQTDSDGRLEVNIAPGAKRGRLTVEPGTENEQTIQLNLGDLDPDTEISGVKKRLANLGFQCGALDNTDTDVFRAALRDFQTRHGLQVTGEVDDQTRQKLRDVHGH